MRIANVDDYGQGEDDIEGGPLCAHRAHLVGPFDTGQSLAGHRNENPRGVLGCRVDEVPASLMKY